MKRITEVFYIVAAVALIAAAAYYVQPKQTAGVTVSYDQIQTVDSQTYDTAPVVDRSQFTEMVTSIDRSQFTEQVAAASKAQMAEVAEKFPKPHAAPTVIDFKVPDVYTSRERAEYAAKNFR